MLDAEQIEMWEYYDLPVEEDGPKVQPPMEMVKEFKTLTKQEPNQLLGITLIDEEYKEWSETVGMHNAVHELKELSDLVYVIYGYAATMCWDLDEAIRRVHDNNLGRCVDASGRVNRRSDGKIIKDPNYPKVKLDDLV